MFKKYPTCIQCYEYLFAKPEEADQGRGGSTTECGFCSFDCHLEWAEMEINEFGEVVNKDVR